MYTRVEEYDNNDKLSFGVVWMNGHAHAFDTFIWTHFVNRRVGIYISFRVSRAIPTNFLPSKN